MQCTIDLDFTIVMWKLGAEFVKIASMILINLVNFKTI